MDIAVCLCGEEESGDAFCKDDTMDEHAVGFTTVAVEQCLELQEWGLHLD